MRGLCPLLLLAVSLVGLPCFHTFAVPMHNTFLSRQTAATTSSSRLYNAPKMTSKDSSTSSPPDGGGPPPMTGAAMPAGGPPTKAGGGPPPGAGGGGGPPPQTPAQKLLEQFLEVAFSILYAGNDLAIRDSSKNLRVLWTRALLASLDKIKDDVAMDMLPSGSRWIVGKRVAPLWSKQVVEKLDWIVNRTEFIDAQLDEFLSETAGAERRQVAVLGSGYDTRSLRYRQANVQFFALDLPEVSRNQATLVQHYLETHDDKSSPAPIHIPFDLNEVLTRNKSLVEILVENGFDKSVPTLVICEAVLFYLIPGAVQKLTTELFVDLDGARYCLTDNLAKVGVTPGPPMPVSARQKCEGWLQQNNKELVAHDSIWGGAIHFVGAK